MFKLTHYGSGKRFRFDIIQQIESWSCSSSWWFHNHMHIIYHLEHIINCNLLQPSFTIHFPLQSNYNIELHIEDLWIEEGAIAMITDGEQDHKKIQRCNSNIATTHIFFARKGCAMLLRDHYEHHLI